MQTFDRERMIRVGESANRIVNVHARLEEKGCSSPQTLESQAWWYRHLAGRQGDLAKWT